MREKDWSQHICFEESDKFYKANKHFFMHFFLKGNCNQKVLDLGCSNGELTGKIANTIGTSNVYGIEINKDMANKAKNKGIAVSVSDLNKVFPFAKETFDIISANQILEHVWNTDNFFREINRVLKKGGYAVISTPNLSAFHSIFFILLGQQTPVIHLIDRQVGNFLRGVRAHGHYKAFNIPALVDLSKYYGFSVETIKGFGLYFLPLLLQKALSKLLGRYAVFLTMRIRKIKHLAN